MKIKREDLQDLYPLSMMQEGMLFHARRAPESPAYVEQVVWRVRGSLDVAEYRAAWDHVHQRYEALRSVFTHDRTREPLQLVLKTRACDFGFESLLSLESVEERERRCRAARTAERAAGFDLATGPLLRVRVFQIAPAEFEVILTWHHVLLDGWSTHAMLADLLKIYGARLTKTEPDLPALPPYARYVDWLKLRDAAASQAYWDALLEGYETAAEIPRLGPARRAPFALEHFELQLEAELVGGLQVLAAATNATLSTVMQAAWGTLVGRYADTNDVVFGVVVSGRSPDVPEIERIPGLLINTIPVRVRARDDDTFVTLVERVQRQALDSQPHHRSRLAEIQQRSELGSALIANVVVFENYPIAASEAAPPGTSVEVVAVSEPTTYDLVVVIERGAPMRISFQYDGGAYARDQIARVAAHLEQFLRRVVAQPDAPLARLDVLSEAESHLLCRELNVTARDYPRESNLAERFAEVALRNPARTAISCDGVAITYEELERRANRLAHHLAARGVKSGDRVATFLDRSPALIEAVLAIVKLGAAYVPHDPTVPLERFTFALADAGIRTVVAMTASDLRLAGITLVCPDAEAAQILASPPTPPVFETAATAEAMLYYTSGSSGQPKAVRVPHRAVLRLVLNNEFVALGPADRVAQISNVAFDAATFEIWGALLNGAELHPFAKETALTPNLFRAELKARGITTMFVTTALFNQIAREAPDAFATLDTLLVGGDRAEAGSVKRVLARGKPKRLLNAYGPTETCTFATTFLVTAVPESGSIPIGRPISNTTAYVVDRAMRLQPLAALGELLIGGDAVTLGYHNRPELDAASFILDPFGATGGRLYRTGDVVRRNLAGEIEFLGRRDSQVKVRGFRIELGEVETALQTFPGISAAVVTLHRDEVSSDQRLIAYLVLHDASLSAVDLAVRNYLSSRLPSYMIPSTFVVLDRLPLNANGKVDRRALPVPSASGMGFARTYVEPAAGLERRLAEIWQAVLGVPSVGRTDSFFELGGHSLTASTAISRIRAELGVDVPLAAIFEAATLEAFAALVADVQRTAPEAPAILPRVSRRAERISDSVPS
jgi:amino acid adenylation domain-containing protein